MVREITPFRVGLFKRFDLFPYLFPHTFVSQWYSGPRLFATKDPSDRKLNGGVGLEKRVQKGRPGRAMNVKSAVFKYGFVRGAAYLGV